jgi:hypothetical protein
VVLIETSDPTQIIFMIFGIAGFIFRIWLCEFRLKPILTFHARYLSRFIAYYYFIAMIFAWNITLLNGILLVSLPTMAFSVIFLDIPFFWKFVHKEINYPDNNLWLVAERLTLHIPCTITAIYWIYEHLQIVYLPLTRLETFSIGLVLLLVPYFLYDKRWTENYEAPRGIIVLVTMLGSWVRFYIFAIIY